MQQHIAGDTENRSKFILKVLILELLVAVQEFTGNTGMQHLYLRNNKGNKLKFSADQQKSLCVTCCRLHFVFVFFADRRVVTRPQMCDTTSTVIKD